MVVKKTIFCIGTFAVTFGDAILGKAEQKGFVSKATSTKLTSGMQFLMGGTKEYYEKKLEREKMAAEAARWGELDRLMKELREDVKDLKRGMSKLTGPFDSEQAPGNNSQAPPPPQA